jgi:hypothetical protein
VEGFDRGLAQQEGVLAPEQEHVRIGGHDDPILRTPADVQFGTMTAPLT